MKPATLHPARAPAWGLIDLGKPRQLRVQISGGIDDVEALLDEVRDAMGDRMNDTDWELNFEEIKPFGDKGPLHKAVIGFIQKPAAND